MQVMPLFSAKKCESSNISKFDLKNLKYVVIVKLKLNYKIGYFRFETKR